MDRAVDRPFTVVGFDHVVLRVADVERSLEFYCDRLGLVAERVAQWRAGEVPFPSVRVSSTTLIDLFAAEHVTAAGEHRNMDHLCVVVETDDLDDVAAAFPGCRRARGLFGAQGDADSVYVEDPDGNVIELRRY